VTACRRNRRCRVRTEAVLAPHPARDAPGQHAQTAYRTPAVGGLLRGVLAATGFSQWWPGTAARTASQQAAEVVVDAAKRATAVRPVAPAARRAQEQTGPADTAPESACEWTVRGARRSSRALLQQAVIGAAGRRG